MQFDRNIINNSFRLSYYQYVLQFRGNYLLFRIVGFIFFAILFSFYGLLMAYFLYLHPYSVTTVAYRDILVSIFLIVFVSALVSLMITSITGRTNPFILSRSDGHFVERVPIELSIYYLSARINGFFETIIFLGIIVSSLFIYTILLVHLPLWRLLIIFIGCFFGLDFCASLSRISFFIFQKFRHQKRLMTLWTGNQAIVGATFVLIPLVALYLFGRGYYISFSTLANFYYLPVINTALALTGSFFRSGMPLVSWEAITLSIIYALLLEILAYNLATTTRSTQDVIDLIPILKHSDILRENLIRGRRTLEPSDIVKNAEFVGNTSFKNKSPVYAFLLKDWLAITRLREMRRFFYYIPLAMGVFIIKYVFSGENFLNSISSVININISSLLLIIPFYIIANYSLFMVQIDYINPLQQYPVNKMDIFIAKGILLVGGVGIACFPLIISEGILGLILVVLTAGLALILGKTRFGASQFGIILIMGVAMFMTAIVSIL